MSKFKVKIEVVVQLQKLISEHHEYISTSHLLEKHLKAINSNGYELWDEKKYPLLNKLSFSDMYNLLHSNYEIEIDAEDEIRNRYYYEQANLNNRKSENSNWYESRGFISGMEFVLHKLNREDILKRSPIRKGEL